MAGISSANLSRNVLWNLIGQVAPLLAAVFAIPPVIMGIGVDRFGLLTLAWMVIGYFSLFDFGLARALIKLVSEKLGEGRPAEIPELVWTALLLMAVLGMAGAAAMFALTGWLVTSVLKIPATLQVEASNTFQLLAWSIPVVILTTGLRGILESYQRFDLVNMVRVPMGIMTFVAPVVVLPFSDRLDAIVSVLLGLRVVVFLIHASLCHLVVPALMKQITCSRRLICPMLGFGGWMTVTNVVGPLMMYMDRFFIGSVLGTAAVAYYVTPYEIISKLLVVPAALASVLFPLFSADRTGNRLRATRLFHYSVRWLLLGLFPVVLMVTVFASDGLRIWLSNEFSLKGTHVLQWLAAGVLINGLACIPFAFIQGAGRPDLTAKLHLVELPLYLVMLWSFMHQWGLAGAAAAWTLRAGFDAIAQFAMSALLDRDLIVTLKQDALILAPVLTVLFAGCWLDGLATRIAFTTFILVCFIPVAWRYLLSANERAFVYRQLPRFWGANTL